MFQIAYPNQLTLTLQFVKDTDRQRYSLHDLNNMRAQWGYPTYPPFCMYHRTTDRIYIEFKLKLILEAYRI